ncbi:2-hydroxychromene-2-carboxylate isomerase [Cohaesibacter celericrescens]|nr:2-hydroxychromene-2-carboxylate isomerase [Cohaesibacter celericrescens]
MSSAKTGPKIEYYFTAISPFAYLGHAVFMEMVQRLDLDVTYRPVQLGKIFGESGGVPVPQRHPARIRNRMLELLRWKDHRGLEMNVQPKFFPTNPVLADCTIIALQQEGKDPSALIGKLLRKVWAEEADIAERSVIAACLSECGEDADAILATAESGAVAAIYEANTQRGLELDIIGAPCVVYQGEAFWGQDKFGFVEEAITSCRPAYTGAV